MEKVQPSSSLGGYHSIQNSSKQMDHLSHASVAFNDSLSARRYTSQKKISNLETFIHFIKGNIGSGLLGMPYAMSLVGILMGPPVLLFVATLCLISMLYLLNTGSHMRKKYNLPPLGYSEVVDLSFKVTFVMKRF